VIMVADYVVGSADTAKCADCSQCTVESVRR